MERFAAWLGGARHRVILLAAALFMLPLLTPLAAALLAFVTLLKGSREGVVSALAAAAILGLVVGLGGGQTMASAVAAFAVLLAVVGAANLVGRSGSLDMAFQLATLALAGLAAVLSSAPPGPEVAGQVAAEFARAMAAAGAGADDAERIASMMSAVLFGVALSGLLFMLVIALLLGRWLEGLVRGARQAATDFCRLQAGRLVTLVASVVLVGALVIDGRGALGNAAIVFAVAFVLQGFAVVHALAAKYRWHAGWLVLLYALLFLPTPASPFMLMGMTTVGYLDNWLRFRHVGRHGPPPTKGND